MELGEPPLGEVVVSSPAFPCRRGLLFNFSPQCLGDDWRHIHNTDRVVFLAHEELSDAFRKHRYHLDNVGLNHSQTFKYRPRPFIQKVEGADNRLLCHLHLNEL